MSDGGIRAATRRPHGRRRVSRSRPTGRLVGLDIARGIAVLGMFVAHTWPDSPGLFSTVLTNLAGGERPRTLFAVVGGISLALFVQSLAGRPGFDSRRIRQTVAVRGVGLVALGLFLQTMYSGVSIVLDTWGLLFLFFLPLLRVPTRWLVGGAVVALPIGVALQLGSEGWDARLRLNGSLFTQPLDWFVNGSYPLLIWIAFLAAGYVLARFDITRRRTQLWMLGGGLIVGVLGQLVQKFALTPESYPAEVVLHLSAVGVAAAIVGALCLASASRMVRGILYPLASVGMMPLTIYTGHVLALSYRYWLDPSQPVKNQLVWVVLTLASLLFATAWRLTLGHGPLERALRALDGSRR
ncbi:hypothetical protein C5B96_06605 [Subtercola sp. Z020]|uniref:DUF418 domain-containing protein n=1 Tax=Subtercola sp. Z020 TaxID=2080582 RepID=UPI000CE71E6F|nr:DUF418 domain-containing protein [Subtercola sp. Z020]PPF85197.1 hypothetical protein C5B96_06605 [Subtercola sp. Z020]